MPVLNTDLFKKINNAKLEIKNTKIKKAGWNDFSKYAYFTPEQIEQLVWDACQNNGLFVDFQLLRNEFGVYGELKVVDIDTGEFTTKTMASEIPTIKATNMAQQLGGCMTYTERYLKTTTFGIVDNHLDFDTSENTKKQVTEAEKTANWITTLKKKAEIVANANYDFLHDVLDKCAIDSVKEAQEIDPGERQKLLRQINEEIKNLGVKK